MNRPVQPSIEETKARMSAILDLQKRLQTSKGPPDARLRKDRLTRAINLVLAHKDEFLNALNEDFGARSREMSLFTDISGAIGPLKYARERLDKWMAPQKRAVTPSALGLFGARAEVRYQPKGVLGVISPWNFPISLAFDAIACAFAAGNRVMLKPSEYTPATSALMAQTVDLYFDEDELAVIQGGPDVGAAFAGLAFDHLIFTGATNVGRHVMRAAADNLVPVTLELGGKSPVVIGKSADLAKTAARVMQGKTMNAGQICLAPDYVLAPSESVPAFIEASKAAVAKMYPTMKDNADYTSIINQRHYDRISGLIADAKAKGGEIVTINPANEDFTQQEHRKIPPTIILNATDDMQVMQEEIFGPLLPVRTVASIDGAIAEINARARPLALYYFGEDNAESEALLERTHSGGVTINDVIFHFAMDELPFGGVGPSGMGAYHGHRGFIEFSHEKAIYRQISAELLAMLRPPYGAAFRKQMAARLKP
ncbi:coniferyl aldehyde dehydrogenase [Candidatus Viadribacter manganicus]|uniref:Aldehyde dehydrogenase n=1 Tax=Candidatus Viadribacter manganicus TaxID=1759059 RepID=A0A1B1AD01_9PROT|nr:coniferyl aldehyde dehydrogenase [Candidatus Viadribacter manganicus]ANP44429.1 aldehyde dehydrogenase [Candidatus Viadribacter manganicus]